MGNSNGKKGQDHPLRHIEHWETVYGTQPEESTSWFQFKPEVSLAMIRTAGVPADAAIIDVGGGTSRLVDHLAEAGYNDITVLDVSLTALRSSRSRLDNPVLGIHWIESDVLEFEPERRYDLWHDRALFHFMTGDRQREAYRDVLERALAPGGLAVIATFALDGPERCSGLPVQRYDAAGLLKTLGGGFELLAEERETHLTPAGDAQSFHYFLLQRS